MTLPDALGHAAHTGQWVLLGACAAWCIACAAFMIAAIIAGTAE